MATNNLTGSTPAATRGQLLHIGNESLSTGATVRLGDGTATPLELSNTGAAVAGTLEVSGAIKATAGAQGLGLPMHKRLSTDATTTSATVNESLSGLDFLPEAGGKYLVELLLLVVSNATSTGIRLLNTSGDGQLMVATDGGLHISAVGGNLVTLTSPTQTTPYLLRVVGTFEANTGQALAWAFQSEAAGVGVTVKAGSVARYTRIS